MRTKNTPKAAGGDGWQPSPDGRFHGEQQPDRADRAEQDGMVEQALGARDPQAGLEHNTRGVRVSQ